MSPDSHPIPAEWLSAYYDGELDVTRNAQVTAHLLTCVTCQRELAGMNLLSQTLATNDLVGLTEPHLFWQNLEPQLPKRAGASTSMDGRLILRRWLPGVGLLLINSLVQLAGLATAILLVLSPRLSAASSWARALESFAISSLIGWPTWWLPADWINLGLSVFFIVLSSGVAVLYLAWLGYELRYGPPTAARLSI